jgi:hypothetical protein
MGGLIRFMLNLGFCAYGVWFTFRGMDGMVHRPCSAYGFFFARVNLFNWYRMFLKVVFVAGIMLYGVFVIFGVPYMVYVGFLFFSKKEYKDEDAKDPAAEQGPSVGQPPAETASDGSLEVTAVGSVAQEENEGFFKPSLTSLGMSGILVFFIITIELMIRWNRINGVNTVDSTGQLLPLIIGIGGIFRVLHRLCINLLKKYW